MSTKLTLSINEQVVAEAKEYAKGSGKSLSKIIEGYLKGLNSKKQQPVSSKLPPVLKRLHGCIKIEDNRDYREIYTEALMDKYTKL